MTLPDIVPGRSCENCTLCCKVLGIAELAKARNDVCTHCDWRKGCQIYIQRPGACRDFDCSYLLSPSLDDAWKPTTSHLVLGYMADADVTLVYVDPDHPGIWRQEPYYSRIKRWAVSDTGYVMVWEAKRLLALAGGEEFDLGEPRADQVIVRHEQPVSGGNKVTIYLVDKDVAAREQRDHPKG